MRLGKTLVLLFFTAASAWCQAPTGLTVKLATSTQTQLTWTGSSATYTVQRALVGGSFANIATASTTSFTDTTLDPYNQTIYQILAGTNAGLASNQVMVGPPPSALGLAATAPLIGNQVAGQYGLNVSLALDGNGDPAFAFFFVDPNNSGDATQTQVLFRNWNRAAAQWNPLVLVATPGDATNPDESVLSLAYDASTKTFGIAMQDLSTAIRLYLSTDGGATWSLKTTFTSFSGTDGPALALASGNIYLAFQSGGADGLEYVTGKLTADPATWTSKLVPSVKNVGPSYAGVSPAIALDNSGNPAIAYWAQDITQSYNAILFFWRPAGTAAPVRITDTQDNQSDVLGVTMVFYQGNPRVGFAAVRGDTTGGGTVHFVRSDDGGNTWLPPVLMPTDGNASTDYPLDIAVDSKDNGALVFNQNVASGDGSEKCAVPKLALSSDLVNWTTCQAAPSLGSFTGVAGAVQIAFGGNDKRYVFFESLGDSQANSGVVIYREPPDNQPTGPVISNVQDAESARTTIVPGEFVALYGANLGGTSRTWTGPDFNGNNLPLMLSGVSVQVNGLPAAVYYISPTQIDFQVPSGVSGTVPVTVTNSGAVSAVFNATVAQYAPSFYEYPAGTNFYPAAVHLDGTLVGDPAVLGSTRKVTAGETIIFFVNGLAPAPSGTIISAPIAYSGAVTVTIGTKTVTPSFSGLVAAGEYQMNVAIPSGLASGNYPITVTVQGQTSPSNITLPVQ